jgi:1,4-alpha-glucan branching enzyme
MPPSRRTPEPQAGAAGKAPGRGRLRRGQKPAGPATTPADVPPEVPADVPSAESLGQDEAPEVEVAVAGGETPLEDAVGEPTSANAVGEPTSASTGPSRDELDRLVGGASHDPHGILGAHPQGDELVVRALKPDAQEVTVLADGERFPAHSIHESGVWEARLPGSEARPYRLEVVYESGTYTVDDSYRFLPTVQELDQHLIGEGRHEKLWTVLGSHVRRYEGPLGDSVVGTSFAVWAPNARGVRIVGDFNYWDGKAHLMRALGSSGVWELFIPDVGDGTKYKYEVLGVDSVWRQKIDPLARRTEVPPATASVVTESSHRWSDEQWMTRRRSTAWHEQPVSIYEVHLGSWRQGLTYDQLADELVSYASENGFTHVEFLPVAEHPFGGSWGYQVSAYYAPTARFGEPDGFRRLVDRLHQAGIGVILDWVPAHFPKDEWALGRFDGTPLYEHADPRRGEQPDWGTYVFDFGRHEVRNFLVANALYWFEEFHVDGLRVDAVASMLYLDYSRGEGGWTPNVYGGRENLEAVAFLQEANATAYREHPGVMMIAEESTAWPGVTRPTHLGGLGFGFKWNMGWMHDTLDYVARDPIYRSYHHHQMTFSMMYAYSENYVLPISHDEVVHGKGSLLRKMPGDRWQQLANLRALLAHMWAHPGKQLLFMGCELGQESEWSESRSLDWWLLDNPDHRGVQSLVRDLNRVYQESPALWSRDTDPAGFSWIDANDADGNVFSFFRSSEDGSQPGALVACIANYAGAPKEGYRVGLPRAGRWTEAINTDAEVYAGSGVGNFGSVQAENVPHHGQPASAVLRIPPLGVLWLRYEG